MVGSRCPRAPLRRAVPFSALVLSWLLLLACEADRANLSAAPITKSNAATANASPGVEGELRVYAAASLTDAFTEIGRDFEAQNPGAHVVFNFGPSSGLRTQIENGAAADVFASADDVQMASAVKSGIVAGEPQPFARNSLAVVLPADNPGKIDSLHDLGRPGVRLVATNPQVPVGAYTLQVLDKLSRDPTYGPEFSKNAVANIRSHEEDVRSLLAKVTLGEADAGVVYTSDITPQVASQVKVIAIPPADNVTATYPIAVVQGSHRPDVAQRFVESVLSDDGQKTLARWGLQPVQ
ncbi:MAG TPA: molybdate ABC transporter substrate-binding protein [Chloroflexota bacterium]|nr:molybdate ABC transporter substrate-binding protein [Chloroflexota bacterium]